jgi:hypothetical protein
MTPHPLFRSFIAAALQYKRSGRGTGNATISVKRAEVV